MAVYINDWECEADMLRDFNIKKEDLQNCEVLFASYTYEDYTGSAYVLLHGNGKFYEVHGSHCSCYGLSESDYMGSTKSQWEMEEVEIEAIARRLNAGWGSDDSTIKILLAEILEKLGEDK